MPGHGGRPRGAHRTAIQGGWQLWPEVMVRAAGFPAHLAEGLALSEKALAVIDAGQGPPAENEHGPLLESELRRIRSFLREVGSDARFREALSWQNREVLHKGVDSLLQRPHDLENSGVRRKQLLIAAYLQRYCLKNDSIGFFGPVGWGSIDAAEAPIRVRPGPTLLTSRQVYFEHWAIDLLAETLAQDPELLPSLVPRRMPTVWVESTTLHHPVARQTELSPEHAAALAACDGVRDAQTIAGDMVRRDDLAIEDDDEVYALLDELAEKKLITWTVELPTGTAHPERRLRQILSRAGKPGEPGLAALDDLEKRRAAVARSAGDPEALDTALAKLAAGFEQHTGQGATRSAGKMYAGRTVVYEDCRRDLTLSIGKPTIDRLGPPLALILQSARWYTCRVAEVFRRVLEKAYEALAEETGSPVVDYLQFWQHAGPHLDSGREPGPLVRQVTGELQARWAEILAIDPAARRVERSAGDLSAQVAEAFLAPHPGWPSARHISPDLLVAARELDALERGDYLLILGELHVGNTLMALGMLEQHPDPTALWRAHDRDIPIPRIIPVEAKKLATRADTVSWSEKDLDLELGASRSWRPRERVLAVGELAVTRDNGGLVVIDRRRGQRHDIIAFLEQYIAYAAAGHFRIAPPAEHCPRITIDRLVVSREQWTLAPADIPLTQVKGRIEQLVAARRWARALGLPRQVFVKIPEETKPVYVDFSSPIFVEYMAKLVRKASQVTITEMLPALDEMWLPDAGGNKYASELRMVAVDPEAWRPPAEIQ